MPGLSRLGRLPRPLLAGAVVTAVLGVALAAVLWPGVGSDRPDRTAALVDDGAGAADLALDARQAAADFRAEDRASRDRAASPLPTPPAGQTPSATPSPAPSAVAKLWVVTEVNVRSGPSADQTRIGSLKALTQVGVTGRTASGWTQVVLDGTAGWVKSDYLSKTKPTPKPSVPSGVSGAPCSISSSIEAHLTANARAVYRAVCAEFGHTVSSFGGYRPGDPGDHGTGRAVDIMVSGDPGTQIARYVQAHASELNVTYVIYQQHIWLAGHPTSEWKLMEDRGSTTANHYDHVHVSVE